MKSAKRLRRKVIKRHQTKKLRRQHGRGKQTLLKIKSDPNHSDIYYFDDDNYVLVDINITLDITNSTEKSKNNIDVKESSIDVKDVEIIIYDDKIEPVTYTNIDILDERAPDDKFYTIEKIDTDDIPSYKVTVYKHSLFPINYCTKGLRTPLPPQTNKIISDMNGQSTFENYIKTLTGYLNNRSTTSVNNVSDLSVRGHPALFISYSNICYLYHNRTRSFIKYISTIEENKNTTTLLLDLNKFNNDKKISYGVPMIITPGFRLNTIYFEGEKVTIDMPTPIFDGYVDCESVFEGIADMRRQEQEYYIRKMEEIERKAKEKVEQDKQVRAAKEAAKKFKEMLNQQHRALTIR
jgi:hypothetical protein